MASTFFRSPLEDTSTPSTDDAAETIDSAPETERTVIQPLTQPGDPKLLQDSAFHVLLEEMCLAHAREELENEFGRRLTKDDPEVKDRAAKKYRFIYDHLRIVEISPPRVETPEHGQLRDVIRKGLSHLSSQSTTIGQSRLPGNANSSTALTLYGNVLPPSESGSLTLPHGLQQIFRQTSSSTDVKYLWLHHPLFDPSRYGRCFLELGVLGKGGYGKVYHVRNPLDQCEYAVKKVALNASRVKRIRERGQAELDVLLGEAKALARLDHPNIVRYYSGWLEYESPDVVSTSPRKIALQKKLLERPEIIDSRSMATSYTGMLQSLQSLRTDRTMSGGRQIIFEDNDESDAKKAPIDHRIQSADSRIQGQSSNMRPLASGLAIEQRSPEGKAASVEVIEEHPESTYPDISVSTTSADSTEMSEPHIILHVQMALYPLNLATFLTLSNSAQPVTSIKHCFHLQISLRIFLEILDGVEYLHKSGYVHRDLKPSNIFMSHQSQTAHKHLDLGCCMECKRSDDPSAGQFLNLRIGDFGLVADLARPQSAGLASPAKAVGTELYQPAFAEAIDACLDVYALGVIAFELLYRFGTSTSGPSGFCLPYTNDEIGMERIDKIQSLRNGVLPEEFLTSYGETGVQVAENIKSMVQPDSKLRPSCATIRKNIENLIR